MQMIIIKIEKVLINQNNKKQEINQIQLVYLEIINKKKYLKLKQVYVKKLKLKNQEIIHKKNHQFINLIMLKKNLKFL